MGAEHRRACGHLGVLECTKRVPGGHEVVLRLVLITRIVPSREL